MSGDPRRRRKGFRGIHRGKSLRRRGGKTVRTGRRRKHAQRCLRGRAHGKHREHGHGYRHAGQLPDRRPEYALRGARQHGVCGPRVRDRGDSDASKRNAVYASSVLATTINVEGNMYAAGTFYGSIGDAMTRYDVYANTINANCVTGQLGMESVLPGRVCGCRARQPAVWPARSSTSAMDVYAHKIPRTPSICRACCPCPVSSPVRTPRSNGLTARSAATVIAPRRSCPRSQ